MSYKEDIYKLGCKLVNCDKSCEGINKINPNKGILPRCLIFENTNHQKERGSIIVGINPGRSKIVEREYYIKNVQLLRIGKSKLGIMHIIIGSVLWQQN